MEVVRIIIEEFVEEQGVLRLGLALFRKH